MSDLRENEHNIGKQIVQMTVYIDNTSYETLLNMPCNHREMLIKAHNIKMEKSKKGS